MNSSQVVSVAVPFNTQGLDIVVDSGGFVMTGFTAELWLELNTSGANPAKKKLPLTVVAGGLTASYTTVGNDFPEPGYYDAELKVYNNAGLLLYSLTFPRYLFVDRKPIG